MRICVNPAAPRPALASGKLGPLRLLLRGLGVGGTASVLLWNMGYDPVFTSAELATAVEIPSYVHDGEMLPHGPKQVAASVMLLVAGHCTAGGRGI